jgi:tRNA A-37 threonylcarbamoyl transferase component Bud32
VPLSPADRNEISAALPVARKRTFDMTLGGETIWVKRPRRGPGYTMYALQAGAASLTGLPLFWPPRVSLGPAGLQAEAHRLGRLARRGWPVPAVIDVSEEWLALRHNGPSVGSLMRNLPVAERARMLRALLAFLQSLHAEGGWHGASQPRNFTRLGDGFGLIDFEDDLEPSMPLALRQARDVALFVMSASRAVGGDVDLVRGMLEEAHARAPAEVDAALRAMAVKLVRLYRLTGAIAERAGPDPRSVAALAKAYRTLL